MSLDSSLNASDLSLEITSEPSNDSADWTGSSVENSEEIRESSDSFCQTFVFTLGSFPPQDTCETGPEPLRSVQCLCNGNRTEWSPIRSVIIRVITKSDDRAAGVRFVYYEYDYRPNWTTRSLITN